jgi:hypothetical protein
MELILSKILNPFKLKKIHIKIIRKKKLSYLNTFSRISTRVLDIYLSMKVSMPFSNRCLAVFVSIKYIKLAIKSVPNSSIRGS